MCPLQTLPGYLRWTVLAVLVMSPLLWSVASRAQETVPASRNDKTSAAGYSQPSGSAPLSLKDCLKKALEDNPLVAEARIGITAAEKAIDSARGKHLPRLSLDANYTRRQDPYPFIPAQAITIIPHFSDSNASWGIALTLPLYEGGQVVEAVNLSRVKKTLQEWSLTLTRSELIGNLVNTYNKILQLAKIRELSAASLEAMETKQRSSRRFSDPGGSISVDLLKIELQVANERQRLLSLDEGLANLSAALRSMMGDPVDRSREGLLAAGDLSTPDFADDFSPGVADAKRKRADVAMAVLAVQEARIKSSIAGGRLFPAVKGYAGYIDQFGFNPWYKEANWCMGITLSLPLFEKSLYDDLERERILQKKVEKRLQTLDNQIRLDIRHALSSVKQCRARILPARKAVELAEESLRLEEKKVEDGADPAVELFLAQTARVTAAASYFQAIFDGHAAIVAYRKAAGSIEDYLH